MAISHSLFSSWSSDSLAFMKALLSPSFSLGVGFLITQAFVSSLTGG